jgi:hypothetical protein
MLHLLRATLDSAKANPILSKPRSDNLLLGWSFLFDDGICLREVHEDPTASTVAPGQAAKEQTSRQSEIDAKH